MKPFWRRSCTVFIIGAAAIIGCGGAKNTGVATFTGLDATDVRGGAVPVAAYAYGSGSSYTQITISFFTAAATSCDAATAFDPVTLSISLPSRQALAAGATLDLVDHFSDPAWASPTKPIASIEYIAANDTIYASVSGTLQLTAASSDDLAGHVSAMLQNGQAITADFDAPACSSLW